MKVNRFARYILSSCVAAAMLAGCGGSQPPIGAPGAMPPFAPATHADRGKSWMLPEAKKQPLIYITATGSPLVSVFTFAGRLVGQLNIGSPQGECADKAGDVWIANTGASEMVEYAHGGKKPISTLEDPGQQPAGCSVNNTTGDLAVTNICNAQSCGNGNLVIYPHASGSPKGYFNERIDHYYFCAYDSDGNLLVDGRSNKERPADHKTLFAELYKNGQTLENVVMPAGFKAYQNVQGSSKTYYAVEGFSKHDTFIYHIVFGGQHGKAMGRTQFNRRTSVESFFISGHQIVTLFVEGFVSFWRYPSGEFVDSFRITPRVQLPQFLVVSKPS
jgi:hypothetical protein